MRGVLSGRSRAVVATGAASGYLRVVNDRHHPVGVWRMARLA